MQTKIMLLGKKMKSTTQIKIELMVQEILYAIDLLTDLYSLILYYSCHFKDIWIFIFSQYFD